MEQFHFLLNSSTKSGTVPQKVEQRSKNVEQPPKSGTGAEIGALLHELWNSSTIFGAVPQFVEQFLLKVEQVQ